ncbi:MAG TPA: hypothetical protein VJJ23_05785 [Candidatus Nanoarchaeia archaeon]|nr:hypothetical protein [Candidatus Nanoarchaeia archaeon]
MKKAILVTFFMLTIFIGLIFLSSGITGLYALNIGRSQNVNYSFIVLGLLFLYLTIFIYSRNKKDLLK